MKLLIASMIAAGAAVIGSSAADAAYTITFSETGTNVTAIGVGTLNTIGLKQLGSANLAGEIIPNNQLGMVGQGVGDVYQAVFTRVRSLVNTSGALASTNTGNPTGAFGTSNLLFVPQGYVSGTALLAATSVFLNQSFQSLGLSPGSVVFSYGTGANADTFTFNISAPASTSAVPEVATWAMIALGFGAAGVAMRARRNSFTVTFTKINFAG